VGDIENVAVPKLVRRLSVNETGPTSLQAGVVVDVGVGLGVGLGVLVGVAVGTLVAVAVTVVVTLDVTEAVGLWVGVGVLITPVGDEDAVPDGVAVAVFEEVPLGATVVVTVGVTVLVGEDEAVADGVAQVDVEMVGVLIPCVGTVNAPDPVALSALRPGAKTL
jgi:hypothetical protein